MFGSGPKLGAPRRPPARAPLAVGEVRAPGGPPEAHFFINMYAYKYSKCPSLVLSSCRRDAGWLRPMTMETPSGKFLLPKYFKIFRLKIRSYRRYGKNGDFFFALLIFLFHAASRGGTCAFTWKFVKTLTENSSRDDRPSVST